MNGIHRWLRITLFSLLIVVTLGLTLRYKIAFSLPFIDQKHLMHSHSHFAFAGWITQALMILMIYYLFKQGMDGAFKRYRFVLWANLITAFGMLLTFPFEGYGPYSITFSTLSIFASYIFVFMYWKDLNKLRNEDSNTHLLFKAALIFCVLSSVGPFSLAYIMSNHIHDQKLHLGSVYFFLHFQYNGWFLFASLGLLISRLKKLSINAKRIKLICWLFVISCIPTLLLSVPWFPLHLGVKSVVVICAILQCAAWIWLIFIIKQERLFAAMNLPYITRFLFVLAAISLTVKLILQLCSSYLPLSHLVFGYRPIVIGYLHLIFLGIFSIFLFGYMIADKLINESKLMKYSISLFVVGIFINEVLLMLQGTLALANIYFPNVNLYLLVASFIMFAGALLINISARKIPQHNN
jgi:hypothetical protein